ncbi:MAG: MFS transporter [Desulfurivibrio sp.]|nr:MFS transporter [Desulfurivibrio sp.]
MNVLLGLFIGLLLLYLIAYSDFVLSRQLKERLAAINAAGWRGYTCKPLNWPLAIGLSLWCWAPPLLLLDQSLYLEYRLILTLAFWGATAGGLHWHLARRTTPRLARQALPLLLAFALVSGLLWGPLLNLLDKFFTGG